MPMDACTLAKKLDNFTLKQWLREVGADRRKEVLRKIKNELEDLGLPKSKLHHGLRHGLLQLMTECSVTIERLPPNYNIKCNKKSCSTSSNSRKEYSPCVTGNKEKREENGVTSKETETVKEKSNNDSSSSKKMSIFSDKTHSSSKKSIISKRYVLNDTSHSNKSSHHDSFFLSETNKKNLKRSSDNFLSSTLNADSKNISLKTSEPSTPDDSNSKSKSAFQLSRKSFLEKDKANSGDINCLSIESSFKNACSSDKTKHRKDIFRDKSTSPLNKVNPLVEISVIHQKSVNFTEEHNHFSSADKISDTTYSEKENQTKVSHSEKSRQKTKSRDLVKNIAGLEKYSSTSDKKSSSTSKSQFSTNEKLPIKINLDAINDISERILLSKCDLYLQSSKCKKITSDVSKKEKRKSLDQVETKVDESVSVPKKKKKDNQKKLQIVFQELFGEDEEMEKEQNLKVCNEKRRKIDSRNSCDSGVSKDFDPSDVLSPDSTGIECKIKEHDIDLPTKICSSKNKAELEQKVNSSHSISLAMKEKIQVLPDSSTCNSDDPSITGLNPLKEKGTLPKKPQLLPSDDILTKCGIVIKRDCNSYIFTSNDVNILLNILTENSQNPPNKTVEQSSDVLKSQESDKMSVNNEIEVVLKKEQNTNPQISEEQKVRVEEFPPVKEIPLIEIEEPIEKPEQTYIPRLRVRNPSELGCSRWCPTPQAPSPSSSMPSNQTPNKPPPPYPNQIPNLIPSRIDDATAAAKQLVSLINPLTVPNSDLQLPFYYNNLISILGDISSDVTKLRNLYKNRPLGLCSPDLREQNLSLNKKLQHLSQFLQVAFEENTIQFILNIYHQLSAASVLNTEELNYIMSLQYLNPSWNRPPFHEQRLSVDASQNRGEFLPLPVYQIGHVFTQVQNGTKSPQVLLVSQPTKKTANRRKKVSQSTAKKKLLKFTDEQLKVYKDQIYFCNMLYENLKKILKNEKQLEQARKENSRIDEPLSQRDKTLDVPSSKWNQNSTVIFRKKGANLQVAKTNKNVRNNLPVSSYSTSVESQRNSVFVRELVVPNNCGEVPQRHSTITKENFKAIPSSVSLETNLSNLNINSLTINSTSSLISTSLTSNIVPVMSSNQNRSIITSLNLNNQLLTRNKSTAAVRVKTTSALKVQDIMKVQNDKSIRTKAIPESQVSTSVTNSMNNIEKQTISDFNNAQKLQESSTQILGLDEQNSAQTGLEISQRSGEVNSKDSENLREISEGGEEEEEEVTLCLGCKKQSTVVCGRCEQACYCTKICQEKHWETTHHKTCKPKEES